MLLVTILLYMGAHGGDLPAETVHGGSSGDVGLEPGALPSGGAVASGAYHVVPPGEPDCQEGAAPASGLPVPALPQEAGEAAQAEPQEVDTGILGDLVGAYVAGEWVSANYLIEWYAQQGELPWLSFDELLEMATTAYKVYLDEQRALLSSSSSGYVRRWGEWRGGTDRWHNPDGTKRNNALATSFSASSSHAIPGATSSGSSSSTSSWNGGTGSTSSASGGFYKHGVWQARERRKKNVAGLPEVKAKSVRTKKGRRE